MVVASTVLYIYIYIIGWLGKLNLLNECDATLKVAKFHAEEVVELGDFITSWSQSAYLFCTIHLVDIECR